MPSGNSTRWANKTFPATPGADAKPRFQRRCHFSYGTDRLPPPTERWHSTLGLATGRFSFFPFLMQRTALVGFGSDSLQLPHSFLLEVQLMEQQSIVPGIRGEKTLLVTTENTAAAGFSGPVQLLTRDRGKAKPPVFGSPAQ